MTSLFFNNSTLQLLRLYYNISLKQRSGLSAILLSVVDLSDISLWRMTFLPGLSARVSTRTRIWWPTPVQCIVVPVNVESNIPANIRHWTGVGLMLGQHCLLGLNYGFNPSNFEVKASNRMLLHCWTTSIGAGPTSIQHGSVHCACLVGLHTIGYTQPTPAQCWASVTNDGPAPDTHWFSVLPHTRPMLQW